MFIALDRLYELLLIRQNERRTVLYFFVVFFLIGFGLALGRGSADALFFKRYGIDYLPVMFTIVGLLLAIVFTLYAAFVDQHSSNTTLTKLLIISGLAVSVCWAVMSFTDSEDVYPIYYLLYEIISEVLILHLSLYITQNFSVQQSKRLVPIIMAGTTSGSVFGGLTLTAATFFINVQDVLIVWMILLLTGYGLVASFHKTNGNSPYYRPGPHSRNKIWHAIKQIQHGIKYTKESKLLVAMTLAFFFMVIAFFTLSYTTSRLYNQVFNDEAGLAAFFGVLCAVNAAIALILQMFVTNKIIKRFGVQKINLIFPAMMSMSFFMLLGAYILPIALIATFTKDVIMPAFQNPVRTMFFNVLPLNVQGRVRAITIGLILPFSMIATGLMLWLIQQVQQVYLLLVAGLLMSLLYLYFNTRMNASYIPAIVSSLRQKLFVPGAKLFDARSSNQEQINMMLSIGVHNKDPAIRFSASQSLLEIMGRDAVDVVMPGLSDLEYPYQDRLIKLICPYMSTEQIYSLMSDSQHTDDHLQATILREYLGRNDINCFDSISIALQSNNPRIMAAGIHSVIANNIHQYKDEAINKWNSLLNSDKEGELLSAIELIEVFSDNDFITRLIKLTDSQYIRVQQKSAFVLSQLNFRDMKVLDPLARKLACNVDYHFRKIACDLANNLDWDIRYDAIKQLLNDPHAYVRNHAAKVLFHKEYNPSELVHWLINHPMPARSQEAIIDVLIQKEPDNNQLQLLAQWLAERARSFVELATYCESQPFCTGACSLLAVLLRERSMESLTLSLKVVSRYEDYTVMTTVLAGISTNDEHVVDNSLEAVLNIKDKAMANILTETFNACRITAVSKSNHWTMSKMRDFCQKEFDPWLLSCLNKTLETSKSYA